jgi:PAS domain S-box-containing protein
MNTTSVKTILLVEDEAIIAMSQQEILSRYGFEVVTAYNAGQAVDAAENPHVDLVLMDIDLGAGRMTGTEAAERILRKRELPIVFCTSHAEKEMVDKVKGITRYGYVLKSAGEFVLLESINMAFELFDAHILLKRENEERRKAEQALKENEDRLRIINELSSDYAYCHKLMDDGSLLPVWHIGSFDTITGYTPEEVEALGGKVSLLSPDDLPRAAEYVRTLSSGSPAVFTARVQTKQGGMRWIQDSGSPWFDDTTGKVIGIYGSVKDITEQRRNEEELTTIYENTPVFLLLLNRELRVRKANAFTSHSAGSPAEMMAGRLCGEALRCLNRLDDAQGCGFGPHCGECVLRQIVADSFENKRDYSKVEAVLPILEKGERKDLFLCISTSFLDGGEEELCLVGIEDITARKESEAALTESEALYRNLMENSIDAVYLMSGEGKVLNVNQVACAMTGYSRDELLSLSIDDIDPNYPSANFIGFWKDKPEGSTVLFESVHRHKEGTLFPVEVNGIFFRLNGTKYLYGVARDLSERLRKEQEYTEHSEAFRMMAENSGSGIAIVQDGRFCYVNDTAVAMSGYTRGDLLALGTGDILERIHPEDRDRLIAGYADTTGKIKAYEEGQKKFDPIEYRYLGDDGRIVWIEIFSSGIYHKGKPAIFVLCNDITARRESVEELRRSEELYQGLFQKSRAVELLIDGSDGRIVDANSAAAAFYGYSAEELKSMKISRLNTLPIEQLRLEMQQALNENVDSFFFRHRLSGGEIRDVEVYSSPMMVRGQLLLHSIIHDISDRIEADRKIRALVQEKELLVRESHHRVKNNMLTICGLLSLEARTLGEAGCREPLVKAAGRLQRMMVLYDRLYRTGPGKETGMREFLPSLVDEIVAVVQTDTEIRTAVEAEDFSLNPEIMTPLGIIVNELITNSIKYAFEGSNEGQIRISVKKRGSTVTLVFADNGIGLPESVGLGNSTGFGLKLIEMMLKQLGGSIAISRNGGTEFRIEIPVPGS